MNFEHVDKATQIAEIQSRFKAAAQRGEGLLLSPEEVALLHSLEEEPAPIPETTINEPELVQKALRLIPKNAFVNYTQDCAKLCVVWSLFLGKLRQWAESEEWSFAADGILIKHNRSTIVIPLTNGETSNHKSQRTAKRVQGSSRINGQGWTTPPGRFR